MEDLITLIFIVVAVLSVFGKIKTQQKKPGATPQSGGWVKKLNDFLAEIQTRVEQQTKEGPDGASDWRRLMEAGKAGAPPSDAGDDTLEDLELEETPPPPPRKAKPAVSPRRDRVIPARKKPIVPDTPPQPAILAEKRIDAIIPLGRADLRKAVIWSEIIGPPVALKERR